MADLSRYTPVAEGIADLLRPFAEVVLHDLATNQIVAIYNAFSKRTVGDDSLIDDIDGIASGPDVHGPFRKTAGPRRSIKYVSIKLKDGRGRAVGLMCINLDVSIAADVKESLAALLATVADSAPLDALFRDDWQERMTTFVHEYLQRTSGSLRSLSPNQRRQLVGELRAAGAFRAKNSQTFAANVLGVSRATIYADLAAVAEELG